MPKRTFSTASSASSSDVKAVSNWYRDEDDDLQHTILPKGKLPKETQSETDSIYDVSGISEIDDILGYFYNELASPLNSRTTSINDSFD